MKRALCFIFAAFFVLTPAAAGTPKRGMVVFRFDDNKSPELRFSASTDSIFPLRQIRSGRRTRNR